MLPVNRTIIGAVFSFIAFKIKAFFDELRTPFEWPYHFRSMDPISGVDLRAHCQKHHHLAMLALDKTEFHLLQIYRAEGDSIATILKDKTEGYLDALINNAAVSPKAEDGRRMGSLQTTYNTWLSVFNVNFFSIALLAQALRSELIAARGTVINITSIAGSRVHPFAGSAYAASKAALVALTRELAHDFGNSGVRVNAVAPGEIETSILSPGTDAIVQREIPLKRLGQPSEVADLLFFLCSDQAAYITGSEIHINGGQHV